MVYRSISTVKADAARRSYDAFGEGITWAVVDSGIDGHHLHFRTHDTLGGDVAELHRDFTGGNDQGPRAALTDAFGHGSHIAGIIAGGLPAVLPKGRKLNVATQVQDPLSRGVMEVSSGSVQPEEISGVAPRCKLVSLKVLDANGRSASSALMRALQYVHEDLNGGGKRLRVHGVNLSLSYPYDQEWFACGQSPLCVEVDRLVRSGVVVVVAAGNSGFGSVAAMAGSLLNTGLPITINDPGNAERAITVGSTHRDQPHTYGVSWFSSKGPTADGRPKPDLVAPGERIASCASSRALKRVYGNARPPAGHVTYLADSGTAMACAHVSGAVAAFLSVHQEFIGRPDDTKRIFLENATSLGRTAEFQGHGLVDLMRALQAV